MTYPQNNNFKTIAILGTGWLGFPLGSMLLRENFSVKGSTTSRDRIPVLSDEGIEPFQIKATSEGILGDIENFLKATDVLIIDFPPGLRKDPKINYAGAVSRLAEAIVASGVKNVIFVSSVSVYEETAAFTRYTEDAEPNATSAAGREILSAENILMKNPLFHTTVIRFGGLIGAGRHPIKYLAGRSGLPNPLGPVNLIHLDDCLQVIRKVLVKDRFGAVFNAVFPLHPPRQKYYTEKAREAGLKEPLFDPNKGSVGKVISSSKAIRELEMEFIKGI